MWLKGWSKLPTKRSLTGTALHQTLLYLPSSISSRARTQGLFFFFANWLIDCLKKHPSLLYPPPWSLKDRHPNELFKFHLNHAHCFILSIKNKPWTISFYEAGEGDDSSELMTWLLYQMKEETIENINRELLTQMLLQHEFLSVFFCKFPPGIKSCSRRLSGTPVPRATYL